MERDKGFKHVVIGDENMSIEEFAKAVLVLVNYRSSVKNSVLDIKTVEGTNHVVVCSTENIEKKLKEMFNAEDVATYPLNSYYLDISDLGKKVASEIENILYEKEEEFLIVSSEIDN